MLILRQVLSLPFFYQLSIKISPWLQIISILLLIIGCVWGLYFAPLDYQQGGAFRIIYIHVPCAFLSLAVYAVIALCSAWHLIWHVKIADVIAAASAPIGLSFTALALITGAIWGKPMWGTWWVWDARLTSELILLFLYCGYIGLRSATSTQTRAKSAAILALVGFVDVPIVHFSVNWWNTLHQGATISSFAKPAISNDMLYPLLLMLVALFVFYLAIMLQRAQGEILEREKHSRWVTNV